MHILVFILGFWLMLISITCPARAIAIESTPSPGLIERAAFIGGTSLTTSCCSNDLIQCSWPFKTTCCPKGTYCSSFGDSCCPSTNDCSQTVESMQTCADPSWVYFTSSTSPTSFNTVCCLPGWEGEAGTGSDASPYCSPVSNNATDLCTTSTPAQTTTKTGLNGSPTIYTASDPAVSTDQSESTGQGTKGGPTIYTASNPAAPTDQSGSTSQGTNGGLPTTAAPITASSLLLSSSSKAAVAAGTVGGLFFIIICVLIFLLLKRRGGGMKVKNQQGVDNATRQTLPPTYSQTLPKKSLFSVQVQEDNPDTPLSNQTLSNAVSSNTIQGNIDRGAIGNFSGSNLHGGINHSGVNF